MGHQRFLKHFHFFFIFISELHLQNLCHFLSKNIIFFLKVPHLEFCDKHCIIYAGKFSATRTQRYQFMSRIASAWRQPRVWFQVHQVLPGVVLAMDSVGECFGGFCGSSSSSANDRCYLSQSTKYRLRSMIFCYGSMNSWKLNMMNSKLIVIRIKLFSSHQALSISYSNFRQ